MALLSNLFEVARKEWGIEVDNSVRKISKPKFDNSRSRRLEGEEARYCSSLLTISFGEDRERGQA